MNIPRLFKKLYAYFGRNTVEYRTIPGFDSFYYLINNPDVALSKTDPLKHYLNHGWKEGRKPSLEFDGDIYLSLNPDIVAAGVNPLKHFIEYGIHEGRQWKNNLHKDVDDAYISPIKADYATTNEIKDTIAPTRLL